jgi:hypothetical protein
MNLPDYDPILSPLELPVQQWRVPGHFEHPVVFPEREGATPGTLLWGAFGEALWHTTCADRQAGVSCNQRVGAAHCLAPDRCVVPWLYKPQSSVHRRQMTRPVLLCSTDLDRPEPVSRFSLEVTLWGRHAVAAADRIEQTLRQAGQAGLQINGRPIRFQLEPSDQQPVATLLQRAIQWHSLPLHSIELAFVTPFLYRDDKPDSQGFARPRYERGERFPLTDMIARAAYELAAWDIEDRDIGPGLDCTQRHALCRDTRDHARRQVEGLQITRLALQPAHRGKRRSRHNGHDFPLTGFTGEAWIGGDLSRALPWLLMFALGGGGQKRAMGFGQIRLRTEA